jgi:dihydrofolate reductase
MRLVLQEFVTLDGVQQAPGGPNEDRSGGFEHGGWLVPYFDDDMGKIIDEWIAQADAFLLGRRTYEIFAGSWPNATDPNDPVANALNGLPKYVASRTLDRVDWNNSRLIEGDVAEGVAKLKALPGRELQVHGSGDFAQTLMDHDLVDEYRLMVYPVVLGAGRRLFRDGIVPHALKLIEAKTTASGITVQRFEAAGKPTYGEVEVE